MTIITFCKITNAQAVHLIAKDVPARLAVKHVNLVIVKPQTNYVRHVLYLNVHDVQIVQHRVHFVNKIITPPQIVTEMLFAVQLPYHIVNIKFVIINAICAFLILHKIR